MNWIGVVFVLAVGLLLGVLAQKFMQCVTIARAKSKAKQILTEARDEAIKIRTNSDNHESILEKFEKKFQSQNQKTLNRIDQHKQRIDSLQQRIESRHEMIEKHENQIKKDQSQIEKLKEQKQSSLKELLSRLEKKSGENRQLVLDQLTKELESETKLQVNEMINRHEQSVESRQDRIARHILGSVIPRCDIVNPFEVSTAVLKFPDDEAYDEFFDFFTSKRDKIVDQIGTDVRFEPEEKLAVVETLEPVPREIAYRTLNNLIQQKKFYYDLIEQGIQRYQSQVTNEQNRAARKAMNACEIDQVTDRIFELLGVLQFRTSFGQHQLTHSKEVAYLGDLMAREVGADAELTRRAGLLHDIGKAIDRQRESGHAVIGAEIAEEEGENPTVVNAIGSHHGDMEPNSVESLLVGAADAISGSRPGARRENVTNYSERIESLLELARDHRGVKKVYAMNAGRELRVRVHRKQITDQDMEQLAREIARDIENELTYSGEIKINTIRETKITRTARHQN
mgnify:CR=1 FL=1